MVIHIVLKIVVSIQWALSNTAVLFWFWQIHTENSHTMHSMHTAKNNKSSMQFIPLVLTSLGITTLKFYVFLQYFQYCALIIHGSSRITTIEALCVPCEFTLRCVRRLATRSSCLWIEHLCSSQLGFHAPMFSLGSIWPGGNGQQTLHTAARHRHLTDLWARLACEPNFIPYVKDSLAFFFFFFFTRQKFISSLSEGWPLSKDICVGGCVLVCFCF